MAGKGLGAASPFESHSLKAQPRLPRMPLQELNRLPFTKYYPPPPRPEAPNHTSLCICTTF